MLDEEGFVYAGFLPVSIKELENREIEIRLDYTEYDSAGIGIIIGNLDKKNHLKDTIEILASSSLSKKYKLEKGNNRVTGVLFEIKMPEGDITGRNHFDYTLEK